MDERQDLRHDVQPIRNPETNSATKYKRIVIITLFIVQFLLPNLALSYGIYGIYFIQQNITIFDVLWPPVIFLATEKISRPWLPVISESLYEYNSRSLFFIGTISCSAGVALCYFFSGNLLSCGFLYGIFGGFGSSLILSLTYCHLDEIFPYETNLILGIHHLGMACGLFVMPLIIKFLIEYNSISYVFLIHGAMLLHILPFGILLGKKNVFREQRLTAYNNFGTNVIYEEEMVEIGQNEYRLSLAKRNWKSPSDNFEEDDEEDEIEENKTSAPLSTQKNYMGVNVLPPIIEKDEDESDEDINKRNSLLLDDSLKRLSVISVKLEGIIQKEEEIKIKEENKQEVLLTVPTNISTVNSISFSVDENLNRQKKSSCCTPYQNHRFRRRIKAFFIVIYKLFLEPVVKSFQILEFYPSLITNIHSLLSPLIFLNFSVFRASGTMEQINLTELSFMFPMVAFAYLVFLIILPWITIISKRNLRYIYISGSLFSALGIYICANNRSDDNIIISCLIYGFGFGVESYLKDVVLKEYLGVSKWSKTENTLECLSGILFIVTIIVFKNIFGTGHKLSILYYSEKWLNLIFYNHLIVSVLWLVFPMINYLFDSLFYKNRGKYNFS